MCKIMEDLRAEGVAEGWNEGRKEGRAEGRTEERKALIASLAKKFSAEEIADLLSLNPAEVKSYLA